MEDTAIEFNEIIPCIACSRCVVVHEAGFLSTDTYLCMDRGNLEVDPLLDGCTFGIEGDPVTGTTYESVITDPCVYGCF